MIRNAVREETERERERYKMHNDYYNYDYY